MPKAGNRNWGKPDQPEASVSTLTEFEKKVVELSLAPEHYIGSTELRAWAAAHKNTHYVPEPLLQAWGYVLDFSF